MRAELAVMPHRTKQAQMRIPSNELSEWQNSGTKLGKNYLHFREL